LYGEEEEEEGPQKNLHKTRVLSLLYFFFSPWHFQITSAHLSRFFPVFLEHKKTNPPWKNKPRINIIHVSSL
jgi:hypothetical protein